MKKRKALYGLLALSISVVVISLVRGHYLNKPATINSYMQLAPYQDGMSLREVYETLPEHGAGHAQLRILNDNTLAWTARWAMIEQASETIDVSYFILKQDIFGVAFLGHLLKKAKQGVKVRILLDAYGSKLSWHPQGNDYLDTLVNSGNVDIRVYRPLLNRAIEGLLNMSLAVTVASEHDKILVVDNKKAITGGRNIATEYFAQPGQAEMVFTDLEVEVIDTDIAGAMTNAFETQFNSDSAEPVTREIIDLSSQQRDLDWAYRIMDAWLRDDTMSDQVVESMSEAGHDWIVELAAMQHLKGALNQLTVNDFINAETRVLDSTTRYKAANDVITQAATRLVKSARKEVFIQTPYVVLPEEALDIFAEASQHDVPIVMFTNSPAAADSVVTQAYFLEQWPYLLASSPTMKLYANDENVMIHSKMATFDGVLSLVGTYNISPLSIATNSELVLAVWSRKFAEKLSEKPRTRLAAGEPSVYEYRIARNEEGAVTLDADGKPIIEFGPDDHIELEKMKKLQLVWKALQAAELLPGISRFF